MDLIRYFAKLARYHAWASARLLEESLSLLTEDEWRRNGGLFFGSVHRTLNHLLVADNIWWGRFVEGRSDRIALDTQLHADRAELGAALMSAANRWAPWIETLDDAQFEGELVYTRGSGEAVRLPFAPTLGHVFNHATHHRGQISAALTAMGKSAPEIDWIYQLQQEARDRQQFHALRREPAAILGVTYDQ